MNNNIQQKAKDYYLPTSQCCYQKRLLSNRSNCTKKLFRFLCHFKIQILSQNILYFSIILMRSRNIICSTGDQLQLYPCGKENFLSFVLTQFVNIAQHHHKLEIRVSSTFLEIILIQKNYLSSYLASKRKQVEIRYVFSRVKHKRCPAKGKKFFYVKPCHFWTKHFLVKHVKKIFETALF